MGNRNQESFRLTQVYLEKWSLMEDLPPNVEVRNDKNEELETVKTSRMAKTAKETKNVSVVRLTPEQQRKARRQLVFASSSEVTDREDYESGQSLPKVLVKGKKSSSKRRGRNSLRKLLRNLLGRNVT